MRSWLDSGADQAQLLGIEYSEPTEALPCHLEASTVSAFPGVLNIKLWSHAPGSRAENTILSEFYLRTEDSRYHAASELVQKPVSGYGRVVFAKQIDLSILRQWLQTCEQVHGHRCSMHDIAAPIEKPPFIRLVDVHKLQLVEISRERMEALRFVALSYVSGSYSSFSLYKRNRAQLHESGGLKHAYHSKELPSTVREAMLVTWKLGEQYLWVDSLCIQQDHEREKLEQISNMDKIYGNAILTIVAADAPDLSTGLRGVEPDSRNLRQLSIKLSQDRTIFAAMPEPNGLESSLWDHRAWTLQEKLLSRRHLLFIGGQVVWQCRELTAFEDMTAGEKGLTARPTPWLSVRSQYVGIVPFGGSAERSIERLPHGDTIMVRSNSFKAYANFLEWYTGRDMRYVSDVLKAPAGLINILEQCFKCPMIFGVPEILLDAAILWRPYKPSPGLPADQLVRRVAFEGDAPSWSWAGWKGHVQYDRPFKATYNADGSFQRVPDGTGQERFRPLLRWYVWRNGTLHLLNGNGLGIPLVLKHGEMLPAEWDQTPGKAFVHPLEWFNLSQPARDRMDSRHLVFYTMCSKAFAFQLDTAQSFNSSDLNGPTPSGLVIVDTYSGAQVGSIQLDGAYPPYFNSEWHDFVIISEAQYLGTEGELILSDDHSPPYLLYNVMLVEWDASREFAQRLGLGRIYKEAWRDGAWKVVILE